MLGRYPTGVTAVTAVSADGDPVGMAVGSFASVSLDPPLVAFFPAKTSSSFPKIREAGSFCVNVLAAHQEFVCRDFSAKGGDKFARVPWRAAGSGSPIIEGALAWIDCSIQSVAEAGDHYLVVGRVNALGGDTETPPLIFFQGGYGQFTAPSLVAAGQDDILEQLRVTELIRRRLQTLAGELGVQVVAVGATRAQLVILGSAGQPRPGVPPARLGHRMPLLAPAGGLFVAWNSDSAVDTWLNHRGAPSAYERNEFLSKLGIIRSRGWSLALSDDAHLELEYAIGMLANRGEPELDSTVLERTISLGRQYDPPELSDSGNHVRLLSAPIFDASSQVILTISLWGLPQPMTASQVERHATVLRKAADAATGELGGRAPSMFI